MRALVLAACALVACTPGGAQPPDAAELAVVDRQYRDPDRPTPAVGDLPASDERVLATRVWLGPGPGAEAKLRPLVLLAHGVDGRPEGFDAFARAVAAEGIVVAAPAFPLSNGEVGLGGLAIQDLTEQVRDVRFVVDQLTADAGDEGGPLWARFDPTRIAALGHSMGGATVLGATRYPPGEPRIGAQVYVSAAMQLEPLFDGDPTRAGPPTLVVQGLDDELVPPAFGEQLYDAIDEPRWYLGLAGADHSTALESQDDPPPAIQLALEAATIAVVREALLGEDGAIDAALDALAGEGHEVR
jgi:alpha-beta hydrolase superfamily lysophospholipase